MVDASIRRIKLIDGNLTGSSGLDLSGNPKSTQDTAGQTKFDQIGYASVIELINAAQELEAQGRKPDAIALYKDWILRNDSKMAFAAHFNLGVLLLQLGHLDESESAFRSSIAIKPSFIEAHQHLTTILEQSERANIAKSHWFDILLNSQSKTDEERELVSLAAKKTRLFAESIEMMQVGWHRAAGTYAAPSGDPSNRSVKSPTEAELNASTVGNTMDRRYVIVAPPYQHNSAGIRVLYELQKWLLRAGLDAIVCTWFNGYPVNQFEEDIVIYPEVAPGNLLNAKRIIRYILNVPGKLGYGDKEYAPEEVLVAYNKELANYSNGVILQVPSIEEFFHADNSEKRLNAVFVGKGKDLGLHPEDCVAITKTYPSTRWAVASLLRSVKTLYMYDNFSMISREAQLCGCEVKLICEDGKIIDYPMSEYPSAQEFQLQLQEFIALTKKLK